MAIARYPNLSRGMPSTAHNVVDAAERLPAEIEAADLRKYFSLKIANREQVVRCRGPANKLDFNVQLCTLRAASGGGSVVKRSGHGVPPTSRRTPVSRGPNLATMLTYGGRRNVSHARGKWCG
jgi:hypothetical protein